MDNLYRCRKELKTIEEDEKIQFAKKQREAIEEAVEHGMLIITEDWEQERLQL